jgi:hypothetical protein
MISPLNERNVSGCEKPLITELVLEGEGVLLLIIILEKGKVLTANFSFSTG